MRIHLSLSLILVLAACATPPAEQHSNLAAKAVCCKDLTEFRYTPLQLNSPVEVPLDDKSPAFNFPSGKSYFSAFSVVGKARRYINVQSHFNGMMIGQYFFPVFLFLDERQQPISQISPEIGFVDARLFAAERNAHMAGIVAVPENARFVVVHTVPADSSSDVATTSPSSGVFMAGRIPVVTQSPGSRIALTRTPTGLLKLRLVDY